MSTRCRFHAYVTLILLRLPLLQTHSRGQSLWRVRRSGMPPSITGAVAASVAVAAATGATAAAASPRRGYALVRPGTWAPSLCCLMPPSFQP